MQSTTTRFPLATHWLAALAVTLPLGLGACGALSSLFASGSGSGTTTSTNKSTSSSSGKSEETLLVNGQPVQTAGDADENEPPKKKSSKSKSTPVASNKKPFKATCHRNSECESDLCWVGSGEFGYCTNMCDDDFGCQDFWKCIKPGNAPQHICVQPED